jgi:predicted GIY-YIG superfamily endonuclease
MKLNNFVVEKMRKPNGYWTKERCREEALKYKTRGEFDKNTNSSYQIALRNGWLDEICSHMIQKRKPVGYWTKERCQEEALKYKTRNEFQNNNNAYQGARKNGCLDEICSHMIWEQKPAGYWTKERCREEALKYKTRNEFRKNSAAYQIALKNNWSDDISSHMGKPIYIKYIIYAYEFSDNYVYVGLTKNKNQRFHYHNSNNKSPVCKHSQKIKSKPKLLIKYEQLVYNDNDIRKQEKFWLNTYVKNGWIPLNKSKTGSLGGITKIWTKERCQEVALKYKTRNEFRKNSGGAYKSSLRNGWLDDVCSHMIRKNKPNGYWTKERCQEEALKYKTRTEFRKNSGGAYKSSLRNNFLNEICSHMIQKQKPNGYWTKERCQEEALKYKTRNEFQKKNAAYYSALKNSWLDDFFPIKRNNLVIM